MEDQRFEESSPFKFLDHERTITGMTPLKLAPQPKTLNLLSRVAQESTPILSLALEDLPIRYTYRLHSRILHHTAITAHMRARLRAFLMQEAARQWIFRETCVLACTFVDLYFLKGGDVGVKQFQTLVIACLIVACKLRQNLLPKICYETFRREELNKWEERVMLRLNFNLNPPSYFDHAQRTVFLWDSHTQEAMRYNLKFSEQREGVNCKLRRFYEQLDCVFMVLASLDLNIEEIVVNLFYLNARLLNVYEANEPHLFTKEEFCEFFYPKDDLFKQFYEKFLSRYCKNHPEVNPQVGNYLKPFLEISSMKKEWRFENEEHLEKIRMWDEVQTVPKECYATVKKIMGKFGELGQ